MKAGGRCLIADDASCQQPQLRSYGPFERSACFVGIHVGTRTQYCASWRRLPRKAPVYDGGLLCVT